MAKCKRNVDNFIDACKRLGVPQVRCLCLSVNSVELALVQGMCEKNLPVFSACMHN